MSSAHKHSHSKKRKFLRHHWKRLLRQQMLAYAVVVVLWTLPIPNPVKILAVTFHELSHALMGILTGAHVYGFAIAPNGAGVTFGVGGNLFLILIAGYIGSAIWGWLLYQMSVRWRPMTCLVALQGIVLATGIFGWLNSFTLFFGLGSMAVVTLLLFTPDWCKVFFVRLVGSACCLYAPLELLGEAFSLADGPRVMGETAQSDIFQLAAMLHVPPFVIAIVLLVAQVALLVHVVRHTCAAGADEALEAERAELDARQALLRELDQIKPRRVLR